MNPKKFYTRPRLRFIEPEGVDGTGAGSEPDDLDQDAVDKPDENELADEDEAEDHDPDGTDSLGDPGKKALDAMKARLKAERTKRQDAERAAREAQDALAAAKGEDESESQRRQIESEALAKAGRRILKAEVRTAAKGVLADPEDALLFLDLDDIEVGDDGEVDTDDIADRIADLVTKKPHLAAQRGPGKGEFDSARRKGAKKRQLTASDVKNMTPGEVNKARKDGLLDHLLGVNR